MSRFRIVQRGALFGLVALTAIAYSRFLSAGFAATDSLPLVETSRFTSLAEAGLLFSRPLMSGTTFAAGEVVYRPFVAFTFGLDHAVWGLNATGFHLTNLVLHLAGVIGMWFLLSRLGLRTWAALGGAALFALHPLVVASVPVIARRDSVAPVTAFVNGAAFLVLADQSRGTRRALALLASLALIALALLSKESAFMAFVMLPMLFAGAVVGGGAGLRETLWRARLLIPHLGLAMVVFGVRMRILGGLGGAPDNSDLLNIDFDRYSQTLGAFTRDLAWMFAWIAPSTRELWPRLAALCLIGLALTIVCLPRRQAWIAASGVLWVAGFAIFCMALKIGTIAWLAYFALVGVALVFAAGVDGALIRLGMPVRGRGWLARAPQVMSASLLIGLLGYGASALSASALIRDYYQWQVAGDVAQRFTDTLSACVAAAPQAAEVRLNALPSSFEDGRFETNLMGVTLLEDWTVNSALRLAFPQRTLSVHVSSWETLRAGAETLGFACASAPPNAVEFTTTY